MASSRLPELQITNGLRVFSRRVRSCTCEAIGLCISGLRAAESQIDFTEGHQEIETQTADSFYARRSAFFENTGRKGPLLG